MKDSKRALVTGANRGIGLAIATALAKAGHEVWLGCRDLEAGERAAGAINARAKSGDVAAGGDWPVNPVATLQGSKLRFESIRLTAIRLDVSDDSSIADAAEALGEIDILVNNAGVLRKTPLLQDPDGFAEAMAVMVEGPYRLMERFTPGMIARGYGRVVNVSSGWGSFSDGLAGPGAYGVAKAALNALTVATARTLPPEVKVNSMCPGWVRTRMGGAGADRSPEEGADTAVWLATLGPDGPTGGFFRDRAPIPW